jgi:ParB family transcriptional regulator, chromosome partitioning protein
MRKRGLGSGLGGLISVEAPPASGFAEVPLAAIMPNPQQPRVTFDPATMQELADSINQYGLLQPLVVMQLPSGDYQLIAGERRLRAAKLAGLRTVPVVVKEVSQQQQLELALIENIQRADLDPIEEARAYAVLEDQFGLTHGEIAQRVGKSRSTISELIGLLKLPAEVQTLVSAGQLTPGHASRLQVLRDPQKQTHAARHIAAQGLSVRRAEEYIAQLHAAPGKELAHSRKQHAQPATPEDAAIVKALEESLDGKRVQLVRSGSGGRLVIYFDDEEMLNSLIDRLITE